MTINVSGAALNTNAELTNPGVWGVDAFGNNIIGQSYTATFTFDTTLGAIQNDASGSQILVETGKATGSISIGGHTYPSTGASLARYLRNSSFLEVTFFDDPNANTGITIQIPLTNTQAISPNLDGAVPTINLNAADTAKSGINAVLGYTNGGVLRASLNVTSFSVSSSDSKDNFLFYSNNGAIEVGHVDTNGKFVETDTGSNFTQNWSQIVPVNDNLVFYRNDGLAAVAHIDQNGKIQQTDSGTNSTNNWDQIVPMNGNLLFYRKDGLLAITHIDQNGKTQQTDAGSNFTQNWSKIVASNENVLFYRNDGLAAVAHIDQNGKLQQTDSGSNSTQNWSQIAPVNGNFLFYRNDGLVAVTHIDQNGKTQQTDASSSFTPNWSKIVPVNGNVFFYRNDGIGAVLHIDQNGKLQQTDSLSGLSHNWSQIVADSSNLLFYNYDGGDAVSIGHIDQNGKFQQTDVKTSFGKNWSTIVAVPTSTQAVSAAPVNAVYDDKTQILDIQDVQAQSLHLHVVLQANASGLFDIKSADALASQQNSQPAIYDIFGLTLTAPSVQAFGKNYKVGFTNIGNYVFRLDSAVELK